MYRCIVRNLVGGLVCKANVTVAMIVTHAVALYNLVDSSNITGIHHVSSNQYLFHLHCNPSDFINTTRDREI